MKHRPRIRHLLTAAAAALALVASSCADEPPPTQAAPPVTEPPPAVEDTPEEPTTGEASPPEVDPCDDPEAEDLGNGLYELDGSRYEMTDVGCMFRPNRPGSGDTGTGDSTEPQEPEPAADPASDAEPEPSAETDASGVEECDEGTHRHHDLLACHADTDTDSVSDMNPADWGCDIVEEGVCRTADGAEYRWDFDNDGPWVHQDTASESESEPVTEPEPEAEPEPEPEPEPVTEPEPATEPEPDTESAEPELVYEFTGTGAGTGDLPLTPESYASWPYRLALTPGVWTIETRAENTSTVFTSGLFLPVSEDKELWLPTAGDAEWIQHCVADSVEPGLWSVSVTVGPAEQHPPEALPPDPFQSEDFSACDSDQTLLTVPASDGYLLSGSDWRNDEIAWVVRVYRHGPG